MYIQPKMDLEICQNGLGMSLTMLCVHTHVHIYIHVHVYTRKCYSIGTTALGRAKACSIYIGSFVLHSALT